MRVLIADDDALKLSELEQKLKELSLDVPGLENLSISRAGSYRSTVKKISEERPSVVLLDMSMPTYDVSRKESGGRPRAFGGLEVLRYMKLKRLSAKVIVVSMYTTFESDGLRKTLRQISNEMRKLFPENFVESIHYDPARSDWSDELRSAMARIVED